jgi:protease secretion system membrane fusion protein
MPPAGPRGKPEAGDDFARVRRTGLLVLGLGFCGFLLWAAFAPLDEGVPSQGAVAIDTKRKAGAAPERRHRPRGSRARGRPRPRRTAPGAAGRRAHARQLEATRHRYLGLRAMQGRLVAEQRGVDTIAYHPDLVKEAADPLIAMQMATQQQLFSSRRACAARRPAGHAGRHRRPAGDDRVLPGQLANRNAQLGFLREELVQTRGLVPGRLRTAQPPARTGAHGVGGAGPRSRPVGQLDARAALDRRAAAAAGRCAGRNTARKSRPSSPTSRATWRPTRASTTPCSEELQRIEIRSPASGQVVGLAVQTVGAVISPGQKLMDVVPEDEVLVLESKVPPHLIDRVHAGLPVDVRFAAFADSPQLVVDGRLVSVSGDLLTEPQTNVTYYLARVQLTPEGYRKLGKRSLQPGMPVEVVLRTGERSLLTYLLHPLTKRLAASMKED